ncbi:hypothetical protein HQ560_09380 [bacterium]|nr:hypothetical protein [bacterium]
MVDKSELSAGAARLRSRLRGVGDHQRSVWLGEGMGLIGAVLIPTLGLTMVLDNVAHLPAALRTIALIGWAATGVLLIRYAARLFAQSLTPEQLALKVEQRFPDVDNRLINSLLLADEEDAQSYELIRGVISEGNADVAKLRVNDAVPKRRMHLLLSASVAAAILMGGYAVLFPQHFANALARVLVPFGGQAPLTRTKILAVTPQDTNVLSGDDLTLAAVVGGAIPPMAEVYYTPDSDDTKILSMHAQDAPGEGQAEGAKGARFASTMTGINNSFDYHVAAGDAESATYRITVHHRPVVSELNITITPPSYAGLKPFIQRSGTVKALAGSTVAIRAACSKPISEATLALSYDKQPLQMAVDGKTVSASFTVQGDGAYAIRLKDTFTFENKPVDHTIEAMPDEAPEIALAEPPPTVTVRPDGVLTFKGSVRDRYGVHTVQIVRVVKNEKGEASDVTLWKRELDQKDGRSLMFNERITASELRIPEGKSGVVQVVASDWNTVAGPGVARSRQTLITVMTPQQAKKDSKEQLKLAVMELAQIIRKQRANLAFGRHLRTEEITTPGAIGKSPARLSETTRVQEEVRADTAKLIARMDDTVPMRAVLQAVYESDMVTAVQQLKAVAVSKTLEQAMGAALDTERTILVRLTGRSERLRRAAEMAALRDVFAALEALIREQKKTRAATLAAGADAPNTPLADQQDKLSSEVIEFKDLLEEQTRKVAQSDIDSAKTFEAAAKLVESRQIRPNMILSAAKLAKGSLGEAVPVQNKVLADLADVERLLREPVAAKAAARLQDLADVVEDTKDKADKLAKLQAKIKELSEELERSKDKTDGKKSDLENQLAEMEDLRDRMADSVEKMAKDLSLFPDIPACNEMVEQAREVFEDIEQAKGSDKNKEAVEIAVDRDEGLLEGIKKIEERIADMEGWLMDKPDGERWKQEGWDKEEIGEVPLVDLPEEMEDLVGDLVDKEEALDEEAQDSSSNATAPDLPAGWDVADGPISSAGAKGKSGNEKPNANEMTGRSGAGREGQANGEIVEGKAKNLEGRETEARRTNDGFQAGEVEEEEGGHPQKANATGGGKQSGTGGEGGLRGGAPVHDELKMRDLERRQRDLRRNVEAVYSKATMMYLPTGELDAAIVLMQRAEAMARKGDFAGFSETQKRIVHALRNTKRMIGGGSAVAMDARLKLPARIREEMVDAKDESIPPEYEKLVSEYYKAIAEGRLK